MARFKRIASLDLEDELSSIEISGANVFPLHRLQKLVELLDLPSKPDFSDIKSYDVVDKLYPIFYTRWTKGDKDSFLAFKGMTHILKGALMVSDVEPWLFHKIVKLSGTDFVPFLTELVPHMIDSEMVQGVNAIDLLLANLAVVTVQTGTSYLRDFIQAVPFFAGFYLGVYRKQFEELFGFMFKSRQIDFDDQGEPAVTIKPHYLTCMHFPVRKIIVSNAPPVKLHRSAIYRKQRKYSCEVSAGGLVSGIKPSLETTDIWVSYLDPSLIGLDKMPKELSGRIFKESVRIPARYRRAPSLSTGNATDDDDSLLELQDFLWEKAENDFLSLQDRLRAFAEQNFHVNPLVILKDDHRGFYNGISNGLFWPAFHNLPKYIIDDYKTDGHALAEDWLKYIKVNFHFCIHTVRSCRSQDFIWIHDYHLILVGQIMRSLDPRINCGFFLHIPFAITPEFMEKYYDQGVAVLRGLLGFKRVGFQTRQDCENYVKLVLKHVAGSHATEKPQWPKGHGYNVTWEGGVTDVGTFPISVKLDAVFKVSGDPKMPSIIALLKNKLVHNTLVVNPEEMTVFLSVERFDYTKGILERLSAIDQYLEDHPDVIGSHIFYQVAATSRADVSSYKEYQNACLAKVAEINEKYKKTAKIAGDERTWIPIIMDTKNNPYEDVIALYKIADVIVVTPIIDGMNLVIKEAILSSPGSVLLLSDGAGATKQFNDAGLSRCYLTIPDIEDSKLFARRLHQATQIPQHRALEHGQRLYEFVTQHDIGHWISTYTDPDWTQSVIQVPVAAEQTLSFRFLDSLITKRREIIGNFLSATHVGEAEEMSLTNVMKTVELYANSGILEVGFDDGIGCIQTEPLLSGVRLDIEFLKSFWISDDLSTVNEVLLYSSGLDEPTFKAQLHALNHFLAQIGKFDVFIVCYEELCVTPRVEMDVSPRGYLAFCQSFTSAILLSRFAWRRGCQLMLLSQIPDNQLKEICSFCQLPPVLSKAGVNDEQLVKNKRVAICANPESNQSIITWLSEHVENLYIIPTSGKKGQPEKSKVFSPVELGVLTAPEVLYAACAAEIQKPIKLSLSREGF